MGNSQTRKKDKKKKNTGGGETTVSVTEAPRGVTFVPKAWEEIDEDAKAIILQYHEENPSKVTKKLLNHMKQYGIDKTALDQIYDHLNRNADEPDSDDDGLFESEEEVDEDPNSSDALLKHPSKFPMHFLEGQYEVKQELGHGAFGVVSLGITTPQHKSLPANTKVAIKKMLEIFGNPSGTKRLIRELRVLRYLSDHPSITKLLDVKIPKPHDLTKFGTILMVFECMDCDLTGHLKNKNIKYTEDTLRSIVSQIIGGLKYMHTANFVHRDLKPQNILLRDLGNGNYACKLCDFGLARCWVRNKAQPKIDEVEEIFPAESVDANQLRAYKFQAKITKHVVTRYYRAPEISLLIQKRELLPAIDIWSVGCIMGELLQMIPGNELGPKGRRDILLKGAADLVLSPRTFHNRPIISKQQLNVIFKFLGTPASEYIDTIKNNDLRRWIRSQQRQEPADVRSWFPNVSDDCLEFMKGMLRYDPNERFDCDACLSHPWLGITEDDPLSMSHEPMIEDFEDVYLNDHQLRLMVVDEILHFNPEWRDHLKLQYTSIVNKTQSAMNTNTD